MKYKTLRTILDHPLNKSNRLKALNRFVRRAILIRITDSPVIYPFIGESQLIVKKGMASAEIQYYTGIYELNEMAFVLHFLREEDLFVDVGANIGVYVLLSSKVVGARTIAFEPIPNTFNALMENVAINAINDKVEGVNAGVGEKEGKLIFTNELFDSVNHVLLDGEKSNSTIEVDVVSLDSALVKEEPSLIKIDVEGFETMVINGANETLRKASLKGIIIELNGLANQFNLNEMKIHETILNAGFTPFQYDAFSRSLVEISGIGDQNTLYLKDVEFVKERIRTAPAFSVLGRSF